MVKPVAKVVHTRIVGSLTLGRFHKDLGDGIFKGCEEIDDERKRRRWHRCLLVLSWACDR